MSPAQPPAQRPTFHKSLCRAARAEQDRYPLTKPQDPNGDRASAVRQLHRALAEHSSFSFVRLGDMELSFLLAMQENEDPSVEYFDPDTTVSSSIAFGYHGLRPEHSSRLLESYEQADYVDFQDRYWFNKVYIPRLRLNRRPDAMSNPSPDASMLFYDFVEHQLGSFVSEHRCLFAGAEAGILARLFEDNRYREVAQSIWSTDSRPFFLEERRAVGEHLDEIKADLTKTIRQHDIQALFLSLGGAAKILCYELAQELSIRTFDLGGQLRALCYLGQDGHINWRAVHNPFLFRVPFDVVMDAIEATIPDLTDEELLTRAHSQLFLELQRKEPGWSYPVDAFDASSVDLGPENLAAYRRSLRQFRRRYGDLATLSPATRERQREFEAWRRSHGIGLAAKLAALVATLGRTSRSILRALFRRRPST